MSEVTTSNVSEAKQDTAEKSNITTSQYAVRRLGELKARPISPVVQREEEPEPKPTPEVAPEVKDAEEQSPQSKEDGAQVPTSETEGKDVLSQVDLSELTDEDIAELAQKGKSGLLKRIAELTAKRKIAEERVAQYEARLQQQQNEKNPLEPKIENNPYASIATMEDLSKKVEETNQVIEWAEDTLDKSDHLGYEDVVTQIDGKDLTKSDIKDYLRRARKARDKFLPAQKKEIDSFAQRKALKFAFEGQASKELDWLSSKEDNDLKRQYQAMMSDPRLKDLEKSMPDVAPQLPYLLAHAANSIYGRKAISLDSKPSLKVSALGNPDSSSAVSGRPMKEGERNVKDGVKRLLDSGSISDFVALRTAQLSKRK
jgi:hypothetical protein